MCESFHLPVQCGSDRVLEAMRRPYTIEHYLGRVARLRERVPNIGLTTDIIVGFPGETEADFEATLELLRQVRYDSIYSFKYSPRPGTRAATMEDDVPDAEKSRRLAEVQRLQDVIYDEILNTYAGKTLEILVEGPSRKASRGGEAALQLCGRTRSNIVVNFPVPMADLVSRRWIGKLAAVRVEKVLSHTLFGTLA